MQVHRGRLLGAQAPLEQPRDRPVLVRLPLATTPSRRDLHRPACFFSWKPGTKPSTRSTFQSKGADMDDKGQWIDAGSHLLAAVRHAWKECFYA